MKFGNPSENIHVKGRDVVETVELVEVSPGFASVGNTADPHCVVDHGHEGRKLVLIAEQL